MLRKDSHFRAQNNINGLLSRAIKWHSKEKINWGWGRKVQNFRVAESVKSFRTIRAIKKENGIIVKKTNKGSVKAEKIDKIAVEISEKNPLNWSSSRRLKKHKIRVYNRGRSFEQTCERQVGRKWDM